MPKALGAPLGAATVSQRSRQGTRPMNRLIVEFFNDGFAKHGLPQIARLKDED